MAHFRVQAGLWRAEVCRVGVRTSATFPTRDAAEAWAHEVETSLKASKSPKAILSHPQVVATLPSKVLDARRRVQHSPEDIVKLSRPAPTTCGVYFLIRDGVVTYVGKTTNLLARLTKHRRMGKVFDSFTFIPCAESEMTQLEGDYIMAYWPAENRAVELT